MSPLYVVLGVAFGFVLSRSGAADYNYIQSMFLFTSFQLYGIIGTAVALTLPLGAPYTRSGEANRCRLIAGSASRTSSPDGGGGGRSSAVSLRRSHAITYQSVRSGLLAPGS